MPIQMLTNRSAQNLLNNVIPADVSGDLEQLNALDPRFHGDDYSSPGQDAFTSADLPLPSGERAGVRGTNHPLTAGMFNLATLGESDTSDWLLYIAEGVGLLASAALLITHRKDIAKWWRYGKKTGDIKAPPVEKLDLTALPTNAIDPEFIDQKGGLKIFSTREKLDGFLEKLGYRGKEPEAGEVKTLRDINDRAIRVSPQMDGGAIYEVDPTVAFDDKGKFDRKMLEKGDYYEYRIRYSFDSNGSLKGWDVRRVDMQDEGSIINEVGETTLSSSGAPIHDLSARDLRYLKELFHDLKAKYPKVTDERFEELAITASKAWYALPLETRQAEGNRVLSVRHGNVALPGEAYTEVTFVYDWVIEAIEKRLQAEGPEGLQTPNGTVRAVYLKQQLRPGEEFFEDLFRPLTVPELKGSHPGADAFMATVTGLIGKDGKVDPAIETLDGVKSILGKTIGVDKTTLPPFQDASGMRPESEQVTYTWKGADVMDGEHVELTTFSHPFGRALFTEGSADPSEPSDILPSDAVLIISKVFNDKGDPVDHLTFTGTGQPPYIELEARLYYDGEGRLTTATLRKKSFIISDGHNRGKQAVVQEKRLVTRIDGGGNVSWPVAAQDVAEPVTVGGATEEGEPLPPELAKQYKDVIDLFAEYDAKLNVLAAALEEEHPELKGRPEFDTAKIRAAVKIADEKYNTLRPSDIDRITQGISARRGGVPKPEVDRMMGLIDNWYKEQAFEILFPKPGTMLMARQGNNRPGVFNTDVLNFLHFEILQIYKGANKEALRSDIAALLQRWSLMPANEKVPILNAELPADATPFTPETAQKTIPFNWVKEQLNGKPSLFTAKNHWFLDLFRVPAVGKIPIGSVIPGQRSPRRSELHPFLLDANGYLKTFYTLGKLEKALAANNTTLPEVQDPLTTERNVFKYTNVQGWTIAVFRSGRFDHKGRPTANPDAGSETEVRYTYMPGGGLIGMEVVKNTVAGHDRSNRVRLADYALAGDLNPLSSAPPPRAADTSADPVRVDSRPDFLNLLRARMASGAAPLVSAEVIARFRGIITEAAERIKAGEFDLAYNSFDNLVRAIEEMPEFSGDTPVVRALKWLKAAAHEAAGDMMKILGKNEPFHHNGAYNILFHDRPTEELHSFMARMEEIHNTQGGQQVAEDYWREVGPDRLFRDPLDALRGGKAKQGMSDVFPPPNCAHLDAAGIARTTREAAKTRREILEAHRKALETARKGRK